MEQDNQKQILTGVEMALYWLNDVWQTYLLTDGALNEHVGRAMDELESAKKLLSDKEN